MSVQNSSAKSDVHCYDISIIGNGASATATFISLCNEFKKAPNISINIIGKITSIGRGQAYDEIYPCLKMNTPAKDISIVSNDVNHFIRWANKRGQENITESSVVDRADYGDYLNETILKYIGARRKKSIVTLIDTIAIDLMYLEEEGIYSIQTVDNTHVHAKNIIIATGNALSDNKYITFGSRNYISTPYPAHIMLKGIKKSADIAIIGSSLSAVDTAICLKHLGHGGKIHMVSRKGLLPNVKGNVESYIPLFCTKDNFCRIYTDNNEQPLTTRQFLRLIRQEFQKNGLDWRKLFRFNEATFYQKIKLARKPNTWLQVLMGIQYEIDLSWRYLSKSNMDVILNGRLSRIMHNVTPIPLLNAEIIYDMISKNLLSIHKGITRVDKKKGYYCICFKNSKAINVDYVINSTGPSRKTQNNTSLFLQNIITKKLASEHAEGGLKVSRFDGAIESIYPRLFSIGEPTCSANPLINNLKLITKNSSELAISIFHNIGQEHVHCNVVKQYIGKD